MFMYHFTSEGHAQSVNRRITRFPFHLTTDLERGPTYGSHAVVYKISGEFKCHVGVVTRSKYANGMPEYIIRNQAELKVSLMSLRHKVYVISVN